MLVVAVAWVDGAVVVGAEAEPVTGSFDEAGLDAVAEVAGRAPRR